MHTHSKFNTLCKFYSFIFVFTLLLSLAIPSSAQGKREPPPDNSKAIIHISEEIVVSIGSRAQERIITESVLPVDVIEAPTLNSSGFTELGQSLQTVAPSFNFSRTQISDGSDLFRPATLRGLQPDQTLVLINGKRRHNQAIFSLAGTVGEGAAGTDMNAIPLSALQTVEVLRDGASAQYGSDAIAGVINLKLKDQPGISTFAQWGQTSEGDGSEITAGISGGISLSSNGFLNIALEHRDADQTNRAQRDIGGSSTIAPGELSPAVRWHFGDPDSQATTLFFNTSVPVGPGDIYAFGGYSTRKATGSGFYRDFNRAERNVPQVYPDGFLPHIGAKSEDISVAVGYKQDLIGEWSMDTSLVSGRNTYDFSSLNTINASIAASYLAENPQASDSEIAANAGPSSSYSGGFEFGQTTLNWDIFGTLGSSAIDNPFYLAFGAEYRAETYSIFEGDFASYACGRNDDGVYPSVIDGTTPADCGFQAYPGLRPEAAVDADRNSYALYAELEKNITDEWLSAVALRYENVDGAGSETTGKLSSRFDFSELLAVRGAVSTGFRAPSLQQSAYTAFTTNIGADGSLAQSFTAQAGSEIPAALGITNLTLEKSTNVGLGLVFTPLKNLSLTVDAYQVKITDRLVLGGFLTADDLAFNPQAAAALQNLGVAQVNFFSNAIDTTTTGLDLIADYRSLLAGGEFSVILAANFNNTEINNVNAPQGVSEDIAFSPISASFLESGQPGERATLSFNWSGNSFSSLLRLNYFGATEVDYFAQNHIAIPGTQATSTVESAIIVDINLSYQIYGGLSLSVGANNLLNETPDELAEDEVLDIITNGAAKYPIRAVPYGFNGTSYYVRSSLKF